MMEVQGERLSDMPDGLQQSLWLVKFTSWKALKASCAAAVGPGGIYCLWRGRNCAYESCPRRIFEEVGIDLDKVPPARAPVKLKKQIQAQGQQIKHLEAELLELRIMLEKKVEA